MPRTLARLLFVPTLLWNLLLGRVLRVRNWWDRVDEHVILGALPFAADVPRLAAVGVRAVVNTCEEYVGPVAEYAVAGIEQLRVPTTDFQPPQLADIEQAVAFMQRHIERGETVYVHCKAGRARSATVVLCWLVAAKGMTVDAAQQLLLAKRPHVKRDLARRAVVLEFAAKYAAAR